MKALVYTANQEMTYCEALEPESAQGDALIAIESVGICGSDMHAYLGHDERRVPPLILGHEAVGTVIEGTYPGQRVVLNPLIACGDCHDCLSGRQNLCAQRDLIGMYRAGAFAEKIALPEKNLIPVPEGISSAKAALTEPGATALHAVFLAESTSVRPVSESRALVIGAGSVGLLAALILKDKGSCAVDIAETNPLRRQTIEKHTDCRVFDPLQTTTPVAHYDLIFDAVGSAQTRQTSIAAVRSGGIVIHIGLMDNQGSMDARAMTLREITFIGTYTYTPIDLQATLQKLTTGALGTLDWIEQRPLQEGSRAFSDLHYGQCAAAKVILNI